MALRAMVGVGRALGRPCHTGILAVQGRRSSSRRESPPGLGPQSGGGLPLGVRLSESLAVDPVGEVLSCLELASSPHKGKECARHEVRKYPDFALLRARSSISVGRTSRTRYRHEYFSFQPSASNPSATDSTDSSVALVASRRSSPAYRQRCFVVSDSPLDATSFGMAALSGGDERASRCRALADISRTRASTRFPVRRRKPARAGLSKMERAGLEPATPSLQSWCSPN